jgi:glutaminase
MAATLANDGVNPMSGKRALHAGYVKNVLSVMHSCGMYDYTGEWSYRIGLPAKSGVSGGVIAVLPGQFGIGIFSPLLDDQGNSCRGIQVCEELSARFKLHLFGARTTTGVSLRRTYRANTVRSIRQRGSVEQAILDRKGQAICVYELQGSLFFGALEQVFRKLAAESATLEYLILDVKRVMGIDECALTLVVQLNVWLATQDKQLIFAHLAPRFADTLKHSRDYVWTDKSRLRRRGARAEFPVPTRPRRRAWKTHARGRPVHRPPGRSYAVGRKTNRQRKRWRNLPSAARSDLPRLPCPG